MDNDLHNLNLLFQKEVNTLKQQHQELLEQQAQSAALSLPSRDGSLPFTSSSVQRGSDLTQNWSSAASGEDKFAQFSELFVGDVSYLCRQFM